MTTKEIAEFNEVSVRTVRRWVDKLSGEAGQNAISFEKLKMINAGESGRSVDWSEDEVYAIMKAGGRGAVANWMREKKMREKMAAPAQNAEAVTKSDLAALIAATVAETIKQVLPLIQGAAVQPKSQTEISQINAAVTPALPPLDPRKELNMIAREAGYAMGDYREPYNQIYKHAYYRLGVNFRERAKNRGMEVLDYAAAEGYIPKLLEIAREIFK